MGLERGLGVFDFVVVLLFVLIAFVLIFTISQKNESSSDSSQKSSLQNEEIVVVVEEIVVKVQKNAISVAIAKQVAFDKLKNEASQFGISLLLSYENKYKQIRDRLFANEELVSALKTAKREGVVIYVERKFAVKAGYVDINIDATDQEIIEFLLGKQD